jgi:hypothetical protein
VCAEDPLVIDPKEARRLLDADTNDELLSRITPEEMGAAWCRYATRARGTDKHPEWADDEDGWAAELYHESEFEENEEFVRAFLVTIVDAAPDEVLGWVGAGPLEDFVAYADEDRLLWIEQRAEESQRFREALRNVADSAWRAFWFEPGPRPDTLVIKCPDPDPGAEAIIRRIQSRL